jgi:hypothetical protein
MRRTILPIPHWWLSRYGPGAGSTSELCRAMIAAGSTACLFETVKLLDGRRLVGRMGKLDAMARARRIVAQWKRGTRRANGKDGGK